MKLSFAETKVVRGLFSMKMRNMALKLRGRDPQCRWFQMATGRNCFSPVDIQCPEPVNRPQQVQLFCDI